MVARLLVEAGQHVPVRVFNPGELPLLVYKGTVVAQMTPLTEGEQPLDQSNQKFIRRMKEMDSTLAEAGNEVPKHLVDLLERSCQHLSGEQSQRVRELLLRNQDVFSKGDLDLGRTDLVRHSINTGDHRPIKQPYRRLPVWQQQEAEKQIGDMLEKEVIEKSTSPWASPIVLVKKKDGSTRFCIDYRRVNEVTIKDAYPLPRIEDTFDALHGAVWFSTLDLASGYWQVELDDEAKEKSAFAVRGGLYQWKVMPFGLCNAPATFERLMERILTGLHWEILLVYLDDVIIYGKTFDEELQRLQTVFQRLRESKLKLKPKKCHLFQKKVAYLGHVVSAEGVATDPEKIEAVKFWPVPGNQTGVRSFLGLASYYRRFIEGFAALAKPLHRLTEKNSTFHWTMECQDAFRNIKERLISAPILAFPAIEGRFILDTDASGYGIGAVLSQIQDGEERVLSYASRTLNKPERNYCVTRRELLAVVYFIKKHRHYLYGREFEVRTDHAALKWLLSFKNPEGQLARWLDVLSEYHFTITHRAGRSHGNADGLSRGPCIQCGNTEEVETQNPGKRRRVKKEQIPDAVAENEAGPQRDETEIPETPGALRTDAALRLLAFVPPWPLSKVRELQLDDIAVGPLLRIKEVHEDQPTWSMISDWHPQAKSYWAQWNQLVIREGVLYRKWEETDGSRVRWQMVVPRKLKDEVLEQSHTAVTAGHFGVAKTLHRIRQGFYWTGHTCDIRSWCRSCSTCCARRAPARKHRAALRQYLVAGPMERMAMDVLGPFPESNQGNKVVLIVADYFTKWMEAFPLPNQEAETVAKKLVEEVVCRFGVPGQLHSDQGRNFESKVMAEMCRLLGIKKTRTTPLNPKSDGLVERFNRTILDVMAKFLQPHKNQRDWDGILPFAMMAYRCTIQESTGESPNMLMFGREINAPSLMLVGRPPDATEPDTDYVRWLQLQIEAAWERARLHLKKSAARQKAYYDQNAWEGKYALGSLVWLYRRFSKKGQSRKLLSPWHGPWMVIKVMSGVTYRIQHGVKGKPRIVHFDRLKDFVGPLPKKWVAWKSRVMGSTEMDGAEGGEDSDQMPVGTGETMLATPRVESEVHTAGVGSEETGSAEGFLAESAGRSGRSRGMPLRLRDYEVEI